jgi:NAD(P)H dehydrogenase (quinone)
MIAVAGVSGHTGHVVADTLLKLGAPVRVIVRDERKGAEWKTRGAEVAIASLGDATALTRALSGATAAYLLIPPIYDAADLLGAQAVTRDAIIRAITESRVGHVVFLSSIGAHESSGTGPVRTLHHAEQALRKLSTPVTILRAPYFLENWAAVLPVVAAQNVLPSFLPLDKALEMAATADIGEYAAGLLAAPPPAALRIVEFGGPRKLSPRDVASDVSTLTGRQITPVHAPLDQVVPTFTRAGISVNAAHLFEEMYSALAADRMNFESPGAPHARGRRTPADVLGSLLARS